VSRRSEITIDLGAFRRNVETMRAAAAPAEVWAVVKADGYGHGILDVARAALDAGASALCVASAGEGGAVRGALPDARILVLGPLAPGEDDLARRARLEATVSSPSAVPEGLEVHLKVDTGMGRWGMSPEDTRAVPRERVVGVMSHLATAEEEDQTHVRAQIERFEEVVRDFPGVTAHLANSAAALALPESRFDAVRSGVALYGLSPFGGDPAEHGLEPVLSWRSYVTLAKTLEAGESAGYGRRFVAAGPTRIGVVPVGYGDGFRRGLMGTQLLVEGARRRVVGAVSMDAIAVELDGESEGAPVTLIGDGLLVEEHARHLGTINYEVITGIRSDPLRATRTVLDG
jgi:alanine racemase